MANVEHGTVVASSGPGGADGIHVAHNYTFATEGLQDAQVVTVDDIGKIALRSDTAELWAAVTDGTGIENWRRVTGQTLTALNLAGDTGTSATFASLASITLPPLNATWAIEGKGIVSHSNLTGTPSLRLRETTVGTSLTAETRAPVTDILDRVPQSLGGSIVTTTADSPSLIAAIQFAVGSGTGTTTVTDVVLTARII